MFTLNKTLNAKLNRPYYIESLPYDRKFAGIRAMHLLCHALNLVGEEAYVYTDQVNPKLRTPKLTEDIVRKHQDNQREPIVIYPEVVFGNPRNACSVVRYILNHPGLIGGPKAFHESDLLCFFSIEFAKNFNWQSHLLLYVPLVDQSIFHPPVEQNKARKGILLYTGRYQQGLDEYAELAKNATLITHQWPETQEELAELLRQSELVYCLTNSAVATEALLCGCPVVFLNTPYTSEFIAQNRCALTEHNIIPYGLALDDSEEEIERAKATLADFGKRYHGLEVDFWNNLKTFIDRTQAMPIQDEPRAIIEPPKIITVSRKDKFSTPVYDEKAERAFDYAIWRQKHALTEAKRRILLERAEQWRESSNYLLIAVFEGSNVDWLQETIESLDQQLYPQWSLAILATVAYPVDAIAEHPMVHWIQCDTDLYPAINQVLAAVDEFDWVAVIDVGVRLAPETLSLFTDYINLKPEWSFIYCDEDSYQINAADSEAQKTYQYHDPKFKSDLNVDWLRSEAYIGGFCLVRKMVLDELHGYCGLADRLNWDMALQILDKLGGAAIGHISEVLLHAPEKVITELEQHYLEQAGAVVLERHLQRKGIQARVSKGLVNNSFFIDYALSRSPSVSILFNVDNSSQFENLAACLTSLFEKTSYTNYQIVIAVRMDAHLLEERIASIATPNVAIRIIGSLNSKQPLLSDALISAIDSELTLFLNPDLSILHDLWLERLIGQALREDVGAVSARIVSGDKTLQHAGIILGMGDFGVADRLNYQLPIDSPGYLQRAQVVQNFSAVSMDCLLVKTALLQEILANEAIADNQFAEVELCLKIRQRQLLIVWTPFVNLLMQNSTQKKIDYEKQRHAADAVLHKYLPDLARDPYFNRHLSLKYRQCRVETETDATWNPDFHDRLRVFAFPANDSGVGEYRVRSPLRALSKASKIQFSLLPNHSATLIPDIVEIERAKPDVIFMQNAFVDFLMNAWQQYRNFNDAFLIFSQDDLIYALPKKHPFQGKWPKDLKKRLAKMLSISDRLIVATEPLKDAFASNIADVRLVPNYLESARWTHLTVDRQTSAKPRVGWAGGSQHLGDLEVILPVIEATQNEVDWIFMGMCPDSIRPLLKEYHTGVTFDRYPQQLASLNLDLAVAPLEHNNFNIAKTNLRLLEYGILGWPVICTDIFPYQNAPVTRVANIPHLWIKAIRERVHDLEALKQEGLNLQQWVLQNYMLEDHLDEWLRALTP